MQKLIIQTPVSLIKYQPPIPVKRTLLEQICKSEELPEGKASLRDLLNILLPPRKYTVSQKSIVYYQYADDSQPSRNDVDILKQKLEGLLKVRKAKSNPICPIRQKIYAEAFDELIRQVLIDCPERGIMLNRIKNQLYLTIAAYCTLYEQSLVFAKSKIALPENDLSQLELEEQKLIQKQHQLKVHHLYLLSKKSSLEQKTREIKTIYQQKREYEMAELKRQSEGLTIFLTQIKKLSQLTQQNMPSKAQNSKKKFSDSDKN